MFQDKFSLFSLLILMEKLLNLSKRKSLKIILPIAFPLKFILFNLVYITFKLMGFWGFGVLGFWEARETKETKEI